MVSTTVRRRRRGRQGGRPDNRPARFPALDRAVRAVHARPGEAARVTVRLRAGRTSFTGRGLTRLTGPGTITVSVGGCRADLPLTSSFALTGPVRTVGADRVLGTPVSVKKLIN